MASATAAVTNTTLLFACSRCFTRHPFEELSPGQQLCKECRGSFPVVKCTYCRSEFQQTSKSTSSICKKCEANVKAYGKPTACEYCNIIAAFIGNKCQRCTNSEKKYGEAVTCDQCKQRCAFDCPDQDRRVDGKLLCWLCSLSLKRALAKSKQHLNNSMDSKSKHRAQKLKSSHKDRHSERRASKGDKHAIPEKKAKLNPLHGEVDPNSSDHVVAVTNLKEKIATLQKTVVMKDQQLLTKDKFITELRAQHMTAQSELRNQMKSNDKTHELKVSLMNAKIQNLLKEVATLSKSVKKTPVKKMTTMIENNSSGTDSPSTN